MMASSVLGFLVLVFSSASSSAVSEVFQEVGRCMHKDFESCLVNRAVDVLLDAADLRNVTKESQGRSSESIEDLLAQKLEQELGAVDRHGRAEGRADQMWRTFRQAWKYIVPLLIGVKLKLATFVPIVLTVLALIAKSAFFSGHFALLLTGLNIALKFWYPKWSSTPTEHHHTYQDHHQQSFQDHHQHSFQDHNNFNYQHAQAQAQYNNHIDNAYKDHRRVTEIDYPRKMR